MVDSNVLSIPRNGLVGEWLLDGNANDTNDGTKNNGTATNVSYANTSVGYQKQSGVFNGSSSYVSIPWINGAAINDSDFSISFWVYAIDTSSWILFYFADRDSSVEFSGWNVRLVLYDGTIQNVSGSVSASKWTHVVCTRSKSSWMEMFVDNVSTSTSSFIGNANFQSWGNTIGKHKSFNLEYLNWYLQSVRLYNRVLTDQERLALWLEGKRKLGNEGYPELMKDCIAYYDFRGDAKDIVWGNDGTVNWATLTTDRFGIANSAYSFNGSNNKIVVGNVLPLSTGFTISALVYVTSNATWYQRIFWKLDQTSNSNSSYVLWRVGNHIYGAVFNGWTQYYFDTAGTIPLNQWTLLTVTWNGSTLKSYIDGVDTGTSVWTASSINNGTSNVVIGSDSTDSYADGRFAWTLACVVVDNVAKSEAEIKALSDTLASSKPYPFTKSLPSNLREGLVLDLQNVYDQSGNGNNGTDVNSPTPIRRMTTTGRRYNGSNQRTTYPSISKTAYTWAVWFKPNASISWAFQYPFTMNDSGGTNVFSWFGYDHSSATFQKCHAVYTWSAFYSTKLNSDIPTDRMSLIVGTYDWQNNGKIAIWKNGCKESELTITWTVATTAGWSIGSWTSSFAFTNCDTPRQMIWNRALSTIEIQQLFHSTYLPS